eukprot:798498_1
MFLGIIIIAVAHGVLLVPALLGEFKFIYKGMKHENDDYDDNIPYKMEKHTNLSDGNIQLMDYNHEQKDGDLMAQLLNLKQKQQTQYIQFEKDFDLIINHVNKLKKENNDLKNENG